jgi:hypothetical protein
MLVRGRKRSLFALFSLKLWTLPIQYGAGAPCVTDLYELLLGIELEDLSLGRKLRCEKLYASSSVLDPLPHRAHRTGGPDPVAGPQPDAALIG